MKKNVRIPIFLVLFLFTTLLIQAQSFTITETLRDSKASGFTFGGLPIVAYLTSGVDDPVGDGWLRLTKDIEYQKGYAIVNQAFPSGLGVLIDLEFKIWRVNDDGAYNGADGFSVFLYDASVNPFSIGGFGGSLGYAPHSKGNFPGLAGGFLGLGVDEYGNYCNPTEGRTGGPGFIPNNLSVRGPLSTQYAWLAGNTALDIPLQFGKTTKRPADTTYFRRVQIEIMPVNDVVGSRYTVLVRMKSSTTGKFRTEFGPFTLPALPPAMLKLGFAASTGAGINNHEVRNLYITTPKGVRLTKEVDKANAKTGDVLTYTMTLYNQLDTILSGLKFNDNLGQLPTGFEVTSVTFQNDGDPLNTATGYSTTNLSNASVTLNAFSHARFIVKGKINNFPAGGIVRNTAIFNVGTSGIIDPDTSNDTATVVTNVVAPNPVAVNDSATTGPTTPVTINILRNDYPNGSPIVPWSVVILTQPSNGTVSVNPSGTVIYTPNLNWAFFDSFTYKIQDEDGYWSNDARVNIKINTNFFIPNVFTPNNDGTNDFFHIVGLELFPNAKLRIINRWGNEVYKSNNYLNDWDGAGLNEGTYYYFLVLNRVGVEKKYNGWVLLKR